MTRTHPLLRFLPTIGAALVVLGCLGTWVSIDLGPVGESVSGLDTDDGKLLLGLTVVLAIGTLLASRRWMWAIVLVLAALALAIAVYDLLDVGSEDAFLGGAVETSAGWGLWLCVLGALVCCGASAWRLVALPRARGAADSITTA